MSLLSKVITLNGVAQNLESGTGTLSTEQSARSVPLRCLILQGGGGNGAAVFVGASNAVTTTDYGYRINASAAGVPAEALDLQASEKSFKLADFWVIGTDTQKLHVLAITF